MGLCVCRFLHVHRGLGCENKSFCLNEPDTGTGFPQAFPIFQAHLRSTYGDSNVLTILAPGLQGIIQGIVFQVWPKSPHYRRITVIMGISTITLAMFLASTASTPWQIFLTQGCLFGFGAILLNFVHVGIFPEWFDKKKGKAMGIIWEGWRVGGLGLPLISQWLLDKRGYAETMRVLIAPMLALLLPCIVLFRGRYASAAVESKPPTKHMTRWETFRSPEVAFYLVVCMINEAVTNAPTMFIMQYGEDLGLSRSDQGFAWTLRVLGMMIGTYVLSWLSDHVTFEVLMAGSALSTSVVHFVLWGLARDRFFYFAYAIAVGLTSGGESALRKKAKLTDGFFRLLQCSDLFLRKVGRRQQRAISLHPWVLQSLRQLSTSFNRANRVGHPASFAGRRSK